MYVHMYVHIDIYVHAPLLSPVQFFATPWIVACQIPCPWDSSGKNTRVGCYFLLQGLFPTQGLNPHLPDLLHFLHWQEDSLPLGHLGSHGCGLVTKSCPTVLTPLTIAHQASLFMGFSRQEYWSGLLFPSPGYLVDPGIKLRSPTLQADSLYWEVIYIYIIPAYYFSLSICLYIYVCVSICLYTYTYSPDRIYSPDRRGVIKSITMMSPTIAGNWSFYFKPDRLQTGNSSESNGGDAGDVG